MDWIGFVIWTGLEFLFAFLFETGADFAGRKLGPRSDKAISWLFSFVCYVVGGYLLGIGSTFIFKNHVLLNRSLRLTALFIIPLVIGFLMMKIGNSIETRGKGRSGLETFFNGAVFAFFFCLARYFAAR